jgi:hypothetical protein
MATHTRIDLKNMKKNLMGSLLSKCWEAANGSSDLAFRPQFLINDA